MTHAPGRLKHIVKQHGIAVDFRCVTPFYSPSVEDCLVGDDGCYWRISCDDDIVAAHIEAFSLKPTASNPENAKRMFRDFPAHWPDIAGRDLAWYAWPHNTGDSGENYAWWPIMAVDSKSSTLYFYWQCFNY